MSVSDTYKQKLLAKYLTGQISSVERHVLEQMALDDPFLFEAMEGYSSVHDKHDENLERVQEALTKKKKTQRKFPFGMAASLVLLIGFASWFFFQNRSEDTATFAEAKNQVISKSSPIEKTTEASGEKRKAKEIVQTQSNQDGSEAIQKPASPIEPAPVPAEKKIKLEARDEKDVSLDEMAEEEISMESAPPATTVMESPSVQYQEDEMVVLADAEIVDQPESSKVMNAKSKSEAAEFTQAINEADDVAVQANSEVKQRRAEAEQEALSSQAGIILDGVSLQTDFDQFIFEELSEWLSEEEIKSLPRELTLSFIHDKDLISNFEVSPSQSPGINAKLLALVKSGQSRLTQSSTIQEYTWKKDK